MTHGVFYLNKYKYQLGIFRKQNLRENGHATGIYICKTAQKNSTDKKVIIRYRRTNLHSYAIYDAKY